MDSTPASRSLGRRFAPPSRIPFPLIFGALPVCGIVRDYFGIVWDCLGFFVAIPLDSNLELFATIPNSPKAVPGDGNAITMGLFTS